MDPVTTYAEAITPLEVEDIVSQLLDDMAELGVDVAGFGSLSVQLALPELQARAQNKLEQLRAQVIKGGNPATAAQAGSSWVDIALQGFFAEPRIPAIAAVWSLQLSTTSTAGPYTFVPGDLTAQDDLDTTYASTEGGRIVPSGTLSLPFTCSTPGEIGNAAPGLIDHLLVGRPGLSVTNAPPAKLITAGRDAETDAAYLVRCLGKWGTRGRGGNRAAFHYLIPKFAPTITRMLIRDDNPAGPGSIGVCLANAAGPATNAEVGAVANGLRPLKPLGSGIIQVTSAAPQQQVIGGTLYGDGTNPNLVADATRALNTLQNTYPIGSLDVQAIYLAKIEEVLMEVPGMRNIKLLEPQGDVPLSPYSVVQFTIVLEEHV